MHDIYSQEFIPNNTQSENSEESAKQILKAVNMIQKKTLKSKNTVIDINSINNIYNNIKLYTKAILENKILITKNSNIKIKPLLKVKTYKI